MIELAIFNNIKGLVDIFDTQISKESFDII